MNSGLVFNSECDKFFYVLDEAQIAGETHMGAFADVNGEIRRPVLRPIIGAWNSTSSESIRFIVSGTGFSFSLFQTGLTSGVGKATGSASWKEVHQNVRSKPNHFRVDIVSLLRLSNNCWLDGGPRSPQRLLNAYIPDSPRSIATMRCWQLNPRSLLPSYKVFCGRNLSKVRLSFIQLASLLH
ncbi:hypothetical protein L208DRAFT_1384647, partial [Tricholoma matsutake]